MAKLDAEDIYCMPSPENREDLVSQWMTRLALTDFHQATAELQKRACEIIESNGYEVVVPVDERRLGAPAEVRDAWDVLDTIGILRVRLENLKGCEVLEAIGWAAKEQTCAAIRKKTGIEPVWNENPEVRGFVEVMMILSLAMRIGEIGQRLADRPRLEPDVLLGRKTAEHRALAIKMSRIERTRQRQYTYNLCREEFARLKKDHPTLSHTSLYHLVAQRLEQSGLIDARRISYKTVERAVKEKR